MWKRSSTTKILWLTIPAALAFVLLSSCATQRTVAPDIATQARAGLKLKVPVLVAVYDGRTSEKHKNAAPDLKANLSRIYPEALQWTDYFSSTPQGRVAVRIRIVSLGASFGSRIISSTGYAAAVSRANGQAVGPWGSVVGSATAQQSLLSSSIRTQGWWIGAAWVDLEVQDFRSGKHITFTIPIASETRESNIWGYKSGDKAAREAWDNVSTRLTRALDSILRTVRDEEE